VDYAAAGSLAWGRNMGCSFARERCSSWPSEAAEQGMFCSTSQRKACTGSSKQYKGYCNLAKYTSSLPSHHQYFTDSAKGGGDQLVPMQCSFSLFVDYFCIYSLLSSFL